MNRGHRVVGNPAVLQIWAKGWDEGNEGGCGHVTTKLGMPGEGMQACRP